MGIDVSVDIEISSDPQAVFVFLADPENDADWIGGVQKSEQLSVGPVSLGTQVRRTAGFMGRSMEYITEITAFEPENLIEMETVSGPFAMIITYEVEHRDQTARVILRNRGGPSGVMNLLSPLMMWMVRKNTMQDLARLKSILEKGLV